MQKLISIILPTYNGSKWIINAVESVIAQSYTDWELLVLDDGSNDSTELIVSQIAQNDPRVRYLKNEENLGIQKTLNKGINESKGEYIARIDDDDRWTDINKLKNQVAFLEENKDYVLIGTGAILIDEEGKELSKFLMPQKDKDIRRKILSKNCFIHSSVLFRKEVALIVGGYDESGDTRHVEDYDLWLNLGTKGKFANLGSYSVSLMQREGTISNSNRINQAKRVLVLIRKFKNIYLNFRIGYSVSVARLVFFSLQKVTPFSNKLLYKIKTVYKKSNF
ncbi:MAG: hypothetical protein QG570_533 [Patescibacteria group bacterium]|nr:hypothetical protein [Patescibacteria group bacterium]